MRKGRYAISELFKPSGIYGRWAKAGLIAYASGIIAMLPFMSLSFYQGPAARALGGADLAFVVGLLVSAAVYGVMSRNRDRDAEAHAIAASVTLLDTHP